MRRIVSSPSVAAALGAALLFGASTPLAKALLRDLSPVLLAGLLYLGSGIGLGLIRITRDRGWRTPPMARKEWFWLLLAIGFGGVLGPSALMLGLTRTAAATASLLLNLEAVLTALLAWIVFRENTDHDPQAVAEAARTFAQKTFGGDYDYLLAHHNHESDPKRPENPHAHLTVKTRGREGQRLDPRKADLQAWREAFAAARRQRDVVAEATPRRVRGVVRKGQRQAIWHMDARQATRVTRWKLIQAVKTASAGGHEAREPWAQAAKERQRKVRRAWNTFAAAFEQAGQLKLAQEIRQFVSTMPPALTEREHFVAEAKKLLAKQQVQDRGRCR
jgi:uncharacterized membrane protein